MKTSVEVLRKINASPRTVWNILTDEDTLVSEDLGILKIEGEIAYENQIKLWADISPNRAFSLKVSEFAPKRSMVWEGGMPFRLFKGKRRFSLTPEGDTTTLHIQEDFTGPLSGMICKSMPDLQPSFDKFADGIKVIAEKCEEQLLTKDDSASSQP